MATADHHELAAEIAEFVQARAARFLAPDDEQEDDEDNPETGIMTSFVLVTEWVGDDGQAWITYSRPDKQPIWRSRGLLSEALHDLP